MGSEGVAYSMEEVPSDLRPLLIDAGWIEERIKRWGISSPIFASKVRGQFPDISDDSLIVPIGSRTLSDETLSAAGSVRPLELEFGREEGVLN